MSRTVKGQAYGPTHISVTTDDRLTLCGLKASDTFPRMLARFVTAHRAGHERVGRPFDLCAECARVAVERDVSFGELKQWP